MSKVYSFRLSDDNPRETQAREVIEVWVREGFSLRQVIVEALLTLRTKDIRQSELDEVVEQLKELILTKDKQTFDHTSKTSLPTSFLVAAKNSVKGGIKNQ